jgi:hypothetical protein
MQVHCPQCGAAIPVDDVNLQTLAARCRECNNIFSVADVVRADTGTGRQSPAEVNAPIPVPGRMYVEEFGATWLVSWRWFTPSVILLILFAAVWDTFLFFWYSTALSGHAPWIAVVFPILHVVAGITMTYTAIACVFNTTIIQTDGRDLTIRVGPIPWRGNLTMSTDSIRQIFFKPSTSSTRNQTSTWYSIYAVDINAQLIRLISGITDINEATFLQRTLERRLHLKPSPVWPAT